MKIVFVFHDAEVYGAPKSLLDLIDGLKQIDNNFRCFAILPYKGPLVQEIEKREIIYQVIAYPRWVHKARRNYSISLREIISIIRNNRFSRALKYLIASYQISKFIGKWEIDMVYTNTSVVATGAIAAFLSHKKHIWHIREFHETIKLDWGKLVFSYMLKKSSAVIFTSYALQRYYRTLIQEANHMVIYNGVVEKEGFDHIKLLKEQNIVAQKKRPFTFCMVGLITYEKGQHEAIKALALLLKEGMDTRLLIAGKGGVGELRQLIQNLQLESYVTILGHVSNPFESVYFHSDAYLMCSVHESFGRVTIEAMAAALPVIGKRSRYSGTEELIQHEVTGLLYDGDEVALAGKMKQLVGNPEKGKQLGENAWHFAKENFNKELYVKKIYNLLRSL